MSGGRKENVLKVNSERHKSGYELKEKVHHRNKIHSLMSEMNFQ
jgi:hypothetical protein